MSQTSSPTRRAAFTSALGTVAGLVVALALMVGFFSWQSQYFFTADTFVTKACPVANGRPGIATRE